MWGWGGGRGGGGICCRAILPGAGHPDYCQECSRPGPNGKSGYGKSVSHNHAVSRSDSPAGWGRTSSCARLMREVRTYVHTLQRGYGYRLCSKLVLYSVCTDTTNLGKCGGGSPCEDRYPNGNYMAAAEGSLIAGCFCMQLITSDGPPGGHPMAKARGSCKKLTALMR